MNKDKLFDLLERFFFFGMLGLFFILIIATMISIIFSGVSESKSMLDFCHSEGYDGFKDNCGFGCEEYVCFKSVNGYEELSDPIALQNSEDEK